MPERAAEPDAMNDSEDASSHAAEGSGTVLSRIRIERDALFAEIRSDRFIVHFFRIWTAGWIVFLFFYIYFAAFRMDSGYYIAAPKYAAFYHRLETLFSVLTSFGLCLFWLHARRRFPSKLARVYALLTTLSQCAYCFYTVWDTRHIGNIPYITWREEPIDLTGWFLLAMNILTLIFLYNCFELDSSPQDNPDAPEPDAETIGSKPDPMEPAPASMEPAPELMSDEARIELLASRFDLTNREKEIAGLVNQGESNQKIADTLYISLNTVKSHMKNIFRKCGVRSRVELVHLISSAARGEETAPAEDSPAED
ncbi:MAG: helix-turn-helix transcriptional regulator [Eubacteriales bacterium]|nr:helix-turn-helix transcriptional regulator [Eubacteriales bacterium]